MSVKLCAYISPAHLIPLNHIYYLSSTASILHLEKQKNREVREQGLFVEECHCEMTKCPQTTVYDHQNSFWALSISIQFSSCSVTG